MAHAVAFLTVCGCQACGCAVGRKGDGPATAAGLESPRRMAPQLVGLRPGSNCAIAAREHSRPSSFVLLETMTQTRVAGLFQGVDGGRTSEDLAGHVEATTTGRGTLMARHFPGGHGETRVIV